MTVTTSQPAVPGSIDLDQVVPPEIRAELVEILDELNALEPQLESIGRRAYDAHRRAEAAQSAAVDALAALPGVDRVDIVDGASELFAVLSGSSAVFDTAVRIGGHLHVWTGCASKKPAWLDEIDKRLVAGDEATMASERGQGGTSE